MRKIVLTLIFLLGITLIVSGIILWMYPKWLDIPGRWLIILGMIFSAIAGLGEGLKGWSDYLFGNQIKGTPRSKSNSLANADIKVNKNLLKGKNKIRIRQIKTEISRNIILGNNLIEIDDEKDDDGDKEK